MGLKVDPRSAPSAFQTHADPTRQPSPSLALLDSDVERPFHFEHRDVETGRFRFLKRFSCKQVMFIIAIAALAFLLTKSVFLALGTLGGSFLAMNDNNIWTRPGTRVEPEQT